jgi:hypothetical protein
LNQIDFSILKSFDSKDKNKINSNNKVIEKVLKKKEMVDFIE